MSYILMLIMVWMQSCQGLLPVADDIEKMADDNALTIKVNKEAMQKETDLKVTVEVINKDDVKP